MSIATSIVGGAAVLITLASKGLEVVNKRKPVRSAPEPSAPECYPWFMIASLVNEDDTVRRTQVQLTRDTMEITAGRVGAVLVHLLLREIKRVRWADQSNTFRSMASAWIDTGDHTIEFFFEGADASASALRFTTYICSTVNLTRTGDEQIRPRNDSMVFDEAGELVKAA